MSYNKLVTVGIIFKFHLLITNLNSTQPEPEALVCMSNFRPSGRFDHVGSSRCRDPRDPHRDAVVKEPEAPSCRIDRSNHSGLRCSPFHLFRPRSDLWEAAPKQPGTPATSGFPLGHHQEVETAPPRPGRTWRLRL